MSAGKVDVLAVMDQARLSMGMAIPGKLIARRVEMANARTAVAELIDAINLYRKELQRPYGAGDYKVAAERLDAALAGIGGDK